jgi:HK97 family phage major capsid protein
MPTIREQFEQAKADFDAAFKAGDVERAKEAGDLAEKLEALVAQADAKGAKLGGKGQEVIASRKDGVSKSFGAWVADTLDLKAFDGKSRASIQTPAGGFKAATDVNVAPSAAEAYDTFYDRTIVQGNRRRLYIRDLFGAETRDADAVTYLVEGALEGNTGISAEGASGNQFHFATPTATTESLHKVFGFYKESWEIVNDKAWLASSIDNRALYVHELAVEDQLLSSASATTNVVGVLNRSGIQTSTYTDATMADSIFEAITSVGEESPFMADAVVMNPKQFKTLRLQKDTNGQYMGGGFFSGAYGTAGGVQIYPDVWGMTTVVTPAIAAGTILVGACKAGGSVFTRSGEGLRVEMTNSDADDFEKDLVTIRIIERLALALRYPAAFVKMTVSA